MSNSLIQPPPPDAVHSRVRVRLGTRPIDTFVPLLLLSSLLELLFGIVVDGGFELEELAEFGLVDGVVVGGRMASVTGRRGGGSPALSYCS